VTPLGIESFGSSGDALPYVLPVLFLIWIGNLALLLQRSDFDPITKLTWVIVVVFVPVVGVLLYWFIAPPVVRPSPNRKIDANQLSGTPWENNPGYTNKDT
jgi:membrane protein implicated in regulation of membrane protease activity